MLACPPRPSLPARRRDLCVGKGKRISPNALDEIRPDCHAHLDMLLEAPGEAAPSEMLW